MALTVKRAGADEYGTWIKMLVVGDPGAGKTRTGSTWPDVLYANCEGGMMSVTDRTPNVIDIKDSAQIKELLDVLAQPATVRDKMLGVSVQTVVIDTLDEIARILIKERLDAERRETFQMQDWGWLGDQLRLIVRSFRNLEMNVIINVHIKSQEDSETGRTYFKPAIQGAMSDELAAYVDLALFMVAKPVTEVVNGKNVRSVSRYMQTYPDAQHPWVKDRSGRLPMEFPINFEDDYERMHKAIYSFKPQASTEISTTGPTKTENPPEAKPAKKAAKKASAAKPKSDSDEPTLDTVEDLRKIAEATKPEPKEEPKPDPEPEPEPEPEVTEPEPEATSETEVETETEPEPTPEPEPEPEEAPAPAADDKPEWQTCGSCGGEVESKDQADLSFIRYKEHLCRSCFSDKKKSR